MSFDDGVKLYGKYVGNWGGAATRWRFDAKNGDTVVKSVTLCPSRKLHLEVTPSAHALREGDTYDMAAVRVRILDENGSPAAYAQLPLQFAASGAAARYMRQPSSNASASATSRFSASTLGAHTDNCSIV